jgi:hypothetical protein
MFVSGTILGWGLGLLVAHFVLWHAPMTEPPQAAIALPDASGISDLLGERSAALPDLSGTYFGGWQDPAGEAPSPLSPLRNAIALHAAEDSASAAPQTTLAANGNAAPASREPEPLPLSPAVPLPSDAHRNEETIRGIIELELPHLTAEQRGVWFEALKDVNKEDVAGILRMWKLLGGPIPDFPAGRPHPAPAPSDSAAPAPSTPVSAADWNRLITRAQEIHRHNLRMANTPGYIPRTPYFVDQETPEGLRPTGLGLRIDFERTQIWTTGFPLDLTVVGAGFFMLKDEQGRMFYARSGRFSLDDQRRLVLRAGERTLTLHPEFKVPGEPTNLNIDPTGTIRKASVTDAQAGEQFLLAFPLTAALLKPMAHGLFDLDAPDAAAAVVLAPPGEETDSKIVQCQASVPMIDRDAELQAIDWLETLRTK